MAMTRSTSTALPVERQTNVDDSIKKKLLNVLLEVYMNDGYAQVIIIEISSYSPSYRERERTSHLLNSQAMNLDALDVSYVYSS